MKFKNTKNNIKIGLKLWSKNTDFFDEAEKLFDNKKIDYIELYTVPGSFKTTISKLKELNVPIILHASHSAHNFNIADQSLLRSNIIKFEEVKKFAKELNVSKIIVHSGYNGHINSALKCLEEFNFKGILIENQPKIGVHSERCIGYLPADIKLFLDKGFGFCFDLAHAYKAATSLNEEPKEFIKKFLKLDPLMFHLSDGYVDNEEDEHLNLGEGNFDLSFLKKCIGKSKNKIVTLEVPKACSSLANDIRNIEYFESDILV